MCLHPSEEASLDRMRLSRRTLLAGALAGGALITMGRPASASTDYRQTVNITFPARKGATYRDDYLAGRAGGNVHGATDIFATMGTPVYAAVGGTVGWNPRDPHATAGYALQVNGTDGRMYAYYHLGPWNGRPDQAYAPGIATGTRVQRGQLIGYLGNSGNARHTPPHLHFEIHDNRVTNAPRGNRINPFNSLRNAESRGDYGGQTSAPQRQLIPVDRVAGSDRIATAIELSRASFNSANHVVIAAAASFADSITAGPLAAARNAPVLIVNQHRLDARVRDEITRLGARSATLVGGTKPLSTRTEREVADAVGGAGNVERLAGDNAFQTAARVADAVWAVHGRRRACVALGRHPKASQAWPDALTAGYYGAVRGQPVLLVSPTEVPAATAKALDGLDEALVIGGETAISAALADDMGRRAARVRRIAGADRYQTAVRVTNELLDHGVSAKQVWAATGRQFADALAAAPAMARKQEALMLVDGTREGDRRTQGWLKAMRGETESAVVIGGPNAVNDAAATRLAERVT